MGCRRAVWSWTFLFALIVGCGSSGPTPQISAPASPAARESEAPIESPEKEGEDSRRLPSSATKSPSGASSAASAFADAGDESVVTSKLETLPTIERGTEAPVAGDPSAEGWTGEAFSEIALQQLQRVGSWLETASVDQSGEVAPPDRSLFASDFSSDELIPSPLRVWLNEKALRVERWEGSAGPSTHRAQNVSDAFRPLRALIEPLTHRKTKFKLFRVESHDGRPRTRQYVHWSGYTKTHAVECNATWIVDWEMNDPDRPPRLRSIEVERYEQVTAEWHRGIPWLVDCSQSLLSRNTSLEACLGYGVEHWEARMDRSCGVFNFGYHGLAIADVNGDQLEDVYVCQTGGLPNHLLVQQPDGTAVDMAASARVDYLDNTRSALMVDLDNDSDADLILAMATGLVFLENNGQGIFEPRLRISSVREAMSLAAADYDQDGLLDVYVCVYYGTGDEATNLPLPVPYFNATNGGKNHLLRNRGNWQWEDVTESTGLDQENHRFSFAATWDDDDGDGDLDLLVVNDFGPNQLYRNDGGRFRNVAQEAGLVDGAFGMSATRADYDHDGDQDIYVSNMFSAAGNRVTFDPRFKPDETTETRAKFQHLARGNSLFRNRGDGTYEDVSVPMDVTMGRWSWGSLFVDLNNDSWDDLLVANGFVTGKQTDDL